MLARHGVIDPDLSVRLVGVAALRNRVVHGYASIDVERIWREVPEGLASLRKYAAAIAHFIKPAP